MLNLEVPEKVCSLILDASAKYIPCEARVPSSPITANSKMETVKSK
jgi:hypothetical protein